MKIECSRQTCGRRTDGQSDRVTPRAPVGANVLKKRYVVIAQYFGGDFEHSRLATDKHKTGQVRAGSYFDTIKIQTMTDRFKH